LVDKIKVWVLYLHGSGSTFLMLRQAPAGSDTYMEAIVTVAAAAGTIVSGPIGPVLIVAATVITGTGLWMWYFPNPTPGMLQAASKVTEHHDRVKAVATKYYTEYNQHITGARSEQLEQLGIRKAGSKAIKRLNESLMDLHNGVTDGAAREVLASVKGNISAHSNVPVVPHPNNPADYPFVIEYRHEWAKVAEILFYNLVNTAAHNPTGAALVVVGVVLFGILIFTLGCRIYKNWSPQPVISPPSPPSNVDSTTDPLYYGETSINYLNYNYNADELHFSFQEAASPVMRGYNSITQEVATSSIKIKKNLFSGETPSNYNADEWQLGFQDAASPVMKGITSFHDDLLAFISAILIFVLVLLTYMILTFNSAPVSKLDSAGRISLSTNKNQPRILKVVHAPMLEIVWTLVPAVLLLIVAAPSFALLYSIDDVMVAGATMKALGNQWFWVYEYLEEAAKGTTLIDSYELGAAEGVLAYAVTRKSWTPGANEARPQLPRLLAVDTAIGLRRNVVVRIVATSADVLHSWAIPSLGVKMDACPGRLNELSIFPTLFGVFFGQCSELCGVNHGFMPIEATIS
jgi:heme/copper-type cytochrome/quinol oxidase subunit 2